MAFTDFIPIYNRNVLIYGWEKRELVYPIDEPNPKTLPAQQAHYCTFGYDNRTVVPRTTTQELQQDGFKKNAVTTKGLRRKIVNFTSYPFIDRHNLPLLSDNNKLIKKKPPISNQQTSYLNPISGPRTPLMLVNSHPGLNRRKVTEFAAKELSPYKFMDDGVSTSPGILCMNYLKKHRSISFDPLRGDYTHNLKGHGNHGCLSFGIMDEMVKKENEHSCS